MSRTSVKIQDNSATWLEQQEGLLSGALRRMAQDAINIATLSNPMKTGKLRQSGHVEGMGLEIKAVYGSNSVRYAAKQETTQFRHYTTPGTGPHFLKKGGDAAVKKGIGTYL